MLGACFKTICYKFLFTALTLFISHSKGGWSLVNIPGDGSTWSIDSAQFVQEKMLQSLAFYKVGISLNDSNSSKYVLEVSFFIIKWKVG